MVSRDYKIESKGGEVVHQVLRVVKWCPKPSPAGYLCTLGLLFFLFDEVSDPV